MYRIRFRLRGIAPILFHRFTEKAASDGDSGATGGKLTMKAKLDEAMDAVYRNGTGLYLPAGNLEPCLVFGAKKAGLKRGKASLAAFLDATVFCEERELSFGVSEPDGIHEVRGRRPPKTGGAMIIRRPMLKEGWSVSGHLVVTEDYQPPEQVRQALEAAGLFVGLCDWRPKYGRFVVEEFEVVAA